VADGRASIGAVRSGGQRRPLRATRALTAVVLSLVAAGAAGEAPGDRPPLRSAAEDGYPPFSFVGADGRASGFSVDLLRAALGAMGREVTFRTGAWPEVRASLEEGVVEVLPLVGRTPEREPLFDFTFPYMTLYGAIVVRGGEDVVRDLDDLRGRDVAVMRGDNAEEFLRREPRGIHVHTTASYEDALRELEAGRHDAVVMQRLVALRLLDELDLGGLEVINRPLGGFRQEFCFAVREGDRETLALLNEGLALVIADGTFRRLHAEWFAALELPPDRRIVVGGDHDFPPFEFLDDEGRPAGLNVDLTRAIARATGVDVEIRLGPWAEVRKALERGEVDALQGMFSSPGRDRQVDFTPPHTAVHYVGVVAGGERAPTTVAECAGVRAAAQRGDIAHDALVAAGFGDSVVPLETQEDALRAVREGSAGCALVARASALYWIESNRWSDLDVGRETLLSPEYCYAVPNGHKAMLAQLSEGLRVVEGSGEYRRIYDRWMGIYQPRELTLGDALRRSALVVGSLLVVLLLVFLWLRLLGRQVRRRTAELRESEERFRRAVAEAPFPIMMHAGDGEVLAISRGWTEITGYREDELTTIGAWVAMAYPGREREFEAAIARTFAVDGRLQQGEFEIVCRDGDRRVWEFASNRIGTLRDGRPLAISMAADVTARNRALLALEERDRLLRMAGQLVRLGGWSVDLPASRVEWSDEVAAIHEMPAGFSPTVAEGIGFYAPEFRDRITEAFRACAEEGVPYDEELQIVAATGRRVWVRTMGEAVRDDGGRIVRVQGAFQDITERRTLEEQLLQSQKIESVGRLAGGVAHDYNNMLTVIIGKAEMARSRLGEGHPVRSDVDEILAAARRSTEITRQLLGFARKQPIAPRRLDLNDTVERMLSMLSRLIGENIDLGWRPGAGRSEVLIDPSQVDQILTNLCVNARDAIAGVGKVTIETVDVTLDETFCRAHPGLSPGDYVMLAVSDDGCGMDGSTLGSVFEPFFTTKPAGEGTGLGLATVYGIVRQNGGFVDVSSEPGVGTTFEIYLPGFRGEGEAAPDERPAATAGAEPRPDATILLVEDDPAILAVIAEMLEGLGYDVVPAAGPREALAVAGAREAEVHLLVTDVVMPEMDGRTLAERLREQRPDLRVLFMSGYTADVIAHQGVLESGVHFLQKPFTIGSLAAAVQATLSSP